MSYLDVRDDYGKHKSWEKALVRRQISKGERDEIRFHFVFRNLSEVKVAAHCLQRLFPPLQCLCSLNSADSHLCYFHCLWIIFIPVHSSDLSLMCCGYHAGYLSIFLLWRIWKGNLDLYRQKIISFRLRGNFQFKNVSGQVIALLFFLSNSKPLPKTETWYFTKWK